MNPENKRFLAAVAFSFLILILYPVYLKWVTPKSVSSPAAQGGVGQTHAQVLQSEKQSEQLPQATQGKNEHFYDLGNSQAIARFSDLGASVVEFKLIHWGKKTKEDGILLISPSPEGEGSFLTSLPGQGEDFKDILYHVSRYDANLKEIEFTTQSQNWRLTKTYRLDLVKPAIFLNVLIENLSDSEKQTPFELTSHFVIAKDPRNQTQAASIAALSDKLVSSNDSKIKKKPLLVEGAIQWQALTRHFFALIIRPDSPAAFSKSTVGDPHFVYNDLSFAAQPVAAGQKLERSFFIYIGPQYYKELKAMGFDQILSQGFFGIFKLGLLLGLQWTYRVVGNYGWAIILITCAVKLLFTPLTHMSFESMKKMQALQPKLKALQEQYKNDQAKLSREMMELYKKHKVNPMGGCLPMFLQIPVFIAFYQVLAQTVELQGAPFVLWIRDLSEPDRIWTLPFSLPFLGDALNVLPLLMLGSMVWQQRLTPQTAGTPEQQKMMAIMPIAFGFIFYSLPSGLVLYWFVNNLLSILHQLFIKGKALPHHD